MSTINTEADKKDKLDSNGKPKLDLEQANHVLADCNFYAWTCPRICW